MEQLSAEQLEQFQQTFGETLSRFGYPALR
jgi:hypothetical protein